MGCCNKTHSGKPISRRRYYGGLAVLGGAQAGALVLVHGLAVPFPRYRKVLPMFRSYLKDTLKSAIKRERIIVEGLDERVEDEICEWEPELEGLRDWAPPQGDLLTPMAWGELPMGLELNAAGA